MSLSSEWDKRRAGEKMRKLTDMQKRGLRRKLAALRTERQKRLLYPVTSSAAPGDRRSDAENRRTCLFLGCVIDTERGPCIEPVHVREVVEELFEQASIDSRVLPLFSLPPHA